MAPGAVKRGACSPSESVTMVDGQSPRGMHNMQR